MDVDSDMGVVCLLMMVAAVMQVPLAHHAFIAVAAVDSFPLVDADDSVAVATVPPLDHSLNKVPSIRTLRPTFMHMHTIPTPMNLLLNKNLPLKLTTSIISCLLWRPPPSDNVAIFYGDDETFPSYDPLPFASYPPAYDAYYGDY